MNNYSGTDSSSPDNAPNQATSEAQASMPLLHNRYRIVKALAQGGFGATYLSKDISLPGEPECVIKQLRPTSNAPHVLEMARNLFKREAKTLGKIGNHPQVPRLLDYFEIDSDFYLVQEYVRGLTLQQEVKQGGPFTEAGVKQFLSEILPVLQYLHENQVIHRDIKPANLIRRVEDGQLVMIDFGAVKDQVSPNFAAASENTALTSYAIGTPGYAPPEQMAMRPVYASDIYALGVTCIYLLSAKAPKDMDYDPATGELLWEKYVHVSDHFVGVLKKMLEVSVKHRYQNSTELLRALDLEPYLDSLAKGMATAKTKPKDKPGEDSSPLSRAASGIRSRRARGTGDNQNMAAGLSRMRSTPSNRTPQSGDSDGSTSRTGGSISRTSGSASRTGGFPQPPAPKKLDARDLQTAYAKGQRDFAECDLSLIILPRANLEGARFYDSKLNRVNLQGANLRNADFGKATLAGANLRDASMVKTYCSHTNFQEADLRGADLTNAYLANANLRGANLCGANLTGARVTNEQLAQAKTNWATTRPDGKKGMW